MIYMVLCDGLPLYDLRDEELVLIDPKLTLEVNKAGSFSFKIPPKHPYYDVIKKMRSEIAVYQDGIEIFCGRVTEAKIDFYNRKNVYCEGELAYLNDSIQRPAEYHDMTVRGYLQNLINIHNAQVEENNVAITFNSACAGESASYDYLSVYYVKNGKTYIAMNKMRANDLAGKTFVIPSTDIYFYWRTDSSVHDFYGFSIDSVALSNAEPLSGTAASLPNYTAVSTTDCNIVQTSHNPYMDNSNLLWHYTYTIPENMTTGKMFRLGAVTVTDSNDSLYRYTNWENTLTTIKEDLVDDLGGYLFIRKQDGVRYIDYLEDFPNTNRQAIEFGKNLLDFTRNFDTTDLATAIIPLGAKLETSTIAALEERLTIRAVNNDVDFVFSQEAVNTYGWIFKTVTWDDVHTATILKSKGEKYLAEVQFENMTIEAKAVDLHFIDGSVEQFKLGDEIRVVSVPHGLDRYFPLTKMVICLDKISNNTVTLGVTGRLAVTASTASNNSDILHKIEAIPSESEILKEAQENATALINQRTKGYVVTTANEQLIMDTDDIETARKVWRWNLNGLGYSKTGYKGSYGTAITMDGQIVGERIVGGSISGEKLDITYRSEVEKQIETAEQSATESAESYTDNKLTAYWTKVQVETSIKNTKDSILITAKEEAVGYTDNKLKSYYSKAQIDVKTNAITSEVNKKVNNSDFGTKITQNAYNVRVAWNNNSNYVQFESGAIALYNGAVSTSQKRAVFNQDGNHFYRDGYYVGKIGTNSLQSDSSKKGLNFDLEYTGAYMTWAAKDLSNAGIYTMKLTYVQKNKGWSNYTSGELHLGCNLDMHGWTLKNPSFEGGGISGTMRFVQIGQMNSDGTVNYWYNGCSMTFKNGILVSGTFNG